MKFQVGNGIDNYISKLQNLEMTAPDAIGEAVYEGANIVADAVKRNLEALLVDDTPYPEKVTAPRKVQKSGLITSFGIAKIRNDSGYFNVKLGFDGYNKLKTKKYPSGQPNAMVARTFEAGNSFTKKTPFVAPAVRATKEQAERKMAQVIDRETAKVMN